MFLYFHCHKNIVKFSPFTLSKIKPLALGRPHRVAQFKLTPASDEELYML